jgi:hypothetical protein
MATQIPLNTFRLFTGNLQSGSNTVYQEQTKDISSIILSAVIANITNQNQNISVKIASGSVTSSLLLNATVPPSESLNPFIGRIVLEKGNALILSTNTTNALDYTLSILENANN